MTKELKLDRAAVIDQSFITKVMKHDFPKPNTLTTMHNSGLTPTQTLAIFHSQLESRHLDLIARELKKHNQSFYTIGSSGHEGNAAIAAALLPQDMAFLHYRSGAFMLQRGRMITGNPLLLDHLYALTAASTDPIASGRHKVFGSLQLNVPPQTSTIASHLPKAVGAALSIHFAKTITNRNKTNPGESTKQTIAKWVARLLKHKTATADNAKSHEAANAGSDTPWEYARRALHDDSIIVCSFGDASINHSTAQGAINAAEWLVDHNFKLPLIFLCEDNGIGISVATQDSWVEHNILGRKRIQYISCDGLNIFDTYLAATKAVTIARREQQPVFLHMKTVRLLGHAGSDIEFHYRTLAEIEAIEADDPLLHSARLLIEHGLLTAEQITAKYADSRRLINRLAAEAIAAPKLNSKAAVMASIVSPKLNRPLPALNVADNPARMSKKCTLAQSINFTLHDLMQQYSQLLIFGEDVGKKGGVYRVTADLQQEFGADRVFDTLLDEQTILGLAIGFAHNGLLPIPEIQFLAYLHNAVDQLRGEAATLSFFSSGQFTNPMVIRLPGLAYQKGFGGHFHNDNAIGFLREIPGIVIACPSSAKDAPALLRSCVALAYQEQRVVVFLEPIALYHTKDLSVAGDNKWLYHYSDPSKKLVFGKISVTGESKRLVIISYGNGYWLSRQAAAKIYEQYGVTIKLIDMRWLAPLPKESLLQAVAGVENILIVDEGRRSGSISEALYTLFIEQLSPLPKLRRLTGEDTFIPLGNAWQYVLPSVADIVNEVKDQLRL